MRETDKKIDMEMFFRALADRTRLRLLNLMSDGEVCVCFFVEILGTNQPKISRHLAYLRRAGIVSARREGKWMHYRINTPADSYAAGVLSDVRAWFAQDKQMLHDRNLLMKVCCAPQLPVQLQGAPRPVSPHA
jgi:ArsR family transcriptional regulator, arsenate/arsenite/antimonite-responsive transcriptional repressor